jgi:hypothetical protein
MNVIEHGSWVRYQPSTIPDDAPPNALFCRRESDGMDWYAYVHPGTNFGADTVKFAAIMRDGVGYVVGPATTDATAMFPADHLVGEITDYVGTDPQGDLGNKVFDPATGAFTDQPPPPARQVETAAEKLILQTLGQLAKRLDALEKRKD